jgi:PLP dependent protein
LVTAGLNQLGENRVQEMVQKKELLPSSVAWHQIGHLQRNKVKYIAPFIHLIHSVDSFDLLKEINKQALNCSRTIDCLMQIHIAQEEAKFGFSILELDQALNGPELATMANIRIRGLMGMATNTDDTTQIEQEFAGLHKLYHNLTTTGNTSLSAFNILSMGMSSDYRIGLANGSTMVRIGSYLFKP